MRTVIARVLGALRALVGRSEWPHPHLCFHHGGSEACEESNRRYGFECPRCHGEQDCNHCAHGHKDEDELPCCYCTGADPRWAPKANSAISINADDGREEEKAKR